MPGVESKVQGYICTPHQKLSTPLLDYWKKSNNIDVMYFVASTFSSESMPYFPNKANHYILASFREKEIVMEDINRQSNDRLTLMFNLNSSLFDRASERLNYISIYFTKYTYGNIEIEDLTNAISKRDRVKKASLASIQILTTGQLRFIFPYSKNAIVLEVDGEKTHQSDQKYCERTRREVARRGILLSNLVSFSILDKIK
ncbi:MAG TPA: hypothetical protein VJ729_16135 [Nitrososphaeraceae archaeon]|nr:hypothetical protein [Nitrososphaeraceae archaeon]